MTSWKPDPWPRKNADADMATVGDGSMSSMHSGAGGSGHGQSTQDAPTAAAPKQGGTKKRAQKRKCCDDADESVEAPDVCNAKGSMSRALTQAPQFLYTVGGEALSGARSTIQASGALWSTDAWMEEPSSWKENRVSVVDPASINTGITRTKYDKAFCAEWITNSQLAVSTKCGHVLRVDRDKQTYKEVELVGSRWVEPPIITEEDLHRYRVDRGGIHSLHANRAKHLLACSGCRDDDNNVYVLDLLSDKWATVKQGRGHKDWVFTLSWISDHAFVTGGRDKSVLLWNPLATDRYVMEPVARYDVHNTKVRCSSYDRDTERLVTMDVSGHVHLWDGVGNGDMRVVRRFQIPHIFKEECTCMTLSDNMLMAGAREAVTIYDPRRSTSILSLPVARMSYWQAFPVYPPSVAARSISVHGCMISIGLSTGGTVICLDKRMLGGGPFEAKVAEQDPTKWYHPANPSRVMESAQALSACVKPYPTLPNWVQSKCCSDVIFAGTLAPRKLAHASLLAPPVKAVRYNLRQRSRIKVPPRFATGVACKSAKSAEKPTPKSEEAQPPPAPKQEPKPASANIGPEVPVSTHVLDLSRYISPRAILKQPHGEVHIDDIVNSGFQVENAIFSHAWSPDGCALFSCGGPLAMGVRGCYMALWC